MALKINRSVVKLYLVAYNLAQASGWALALILIFKKVSISHSIEGSFDAAGSLIRILQLSALLEVFHAALGIVPSAVLPSFLQWGGRYHWIAAVVCEVKQVQKLPSVFITFVAWSLSEVVRYPQYALHTLGCCPWWLTWLRYSAFIPLYPIGALCGEVLLLYQALPFLKTLNLYNRIFRFLPFSYYNFIQGVLVVYPFLWVSLYIYMFRQRKSKLSNQSSKQKAATKKSN